MAGDWIKLEHVTPDKPEVVGIATRLGIDQDSAFGKLCRLWIWADQQTFDGSAGGNGVSVTKTFIDRCTFATGFADAMESVGWLTLNLDGSVMFPNFDRHNGETAKQRALTSKRVAKCRSEKKRKCNGDGVTSSVTQALPEKRREESINTPIVPTKKRRTGTREYTEAFGLFWTAYPRREAKAAAFDAFQAAVARVGQRDGSSGWEFIVERARRYAECTAGSDRIHPHPATWLNQDRFDDDQEAWSSRPVKRPEPATPVNSTPRKPPMFLN